MTIFQVILALGTVAVPVFFIYVDICRMWYQARAEVKKIAEEAGTS